MKEIDTRVNDLQDWSEKLDSHMEKCVTRFDSEKVKMMQEVESKFNWYIG